VSVSAGTLAAARKSGLIVSGEPLLVMLSGGADSVCLLDVAIQLGADVSALHVNYGLRGEDSKADADHCRALCASLGVPLRVEGVDLPDDGNLQAAAREARYALAERLTTGDYAAAHTLSDQAETVLYRLATSPGRRALLGMQARRGRLVRPLLALTSAQTREHCRERGLAWREDASNADPRFARTRIRAEVLPVLRDIGPAVERTIAETAAQLQDENEVLNALAAETLARLGGAVVPLELLRQEPPALARLILRRMAETAAGRAVSITRETCAGILGLSSTGSAVLDLGGGLRVVTEYGAVRFSAEAPAASSAAMEMSVPGYVRFGSWDVEAVAGRAGEAVLSAGALGSSVTVRAWREGDRIRPAGMGGSSKSLQDLFTDRKVPRELRRTLPVVEARGEIAWVAGVAIGQHFIPTGGETIALTARMRS
jgi:tRNA(Ile)-lysidine synthase